MSGDSIATAMNILIHVGMLLSILVAVFVFYVSKVEHTALQAHIQESVDGAMEKMMVGLSPNEKQKLKSFLSDNPEIIDRFKAANEKRDPLVVEYNTQLLQRMVLCVGAILLALVTMIWTLGAGCGVSAAKALRFLVLENVCVFIFALAFEVYFFQHIVSKFVPLPPSAIAKYAQKATRDVLKDM
jgi:ABC-type multidrug transport system fused ATPase/permease subunit